MKSDPAAARPRRPYRQGKRAEAAANNASRILDAFAAQLRTRWYDEITLDEVARSAGVTVQTVIRRFGGKQGLLEATIALLSDGILARRATPPGDLDAAVAAVVLDYEQTGDLILHLLGQEDRSAAVRAMVEKGRGQHRAWVTATAAPLLELQSAPTRRACIDGLVVAMDLYTWKLVRRDMGRSVAATTALMRRLARGAIDDRSEES